MVPCHVCSHSSYILCETYFDIFSDIVYTPADLIERHITDPNAITLSLSDASSLENLTIHFAVENLHDNLLYRKFAENPIPSICQLIRTLPPSNSLRYICIILAFSNSSPLESDINIDWSALVEAVFGCVLLVKLELMVLVDHLNEPSKAAIKKRLRQDAVLSRLIHRGLLYVTVEKKGKEYDAW